MSNSPRVSVVIPTYNRSRYVGQAVESVLGQTYPAAEVVVVDDGSTDDTGDQLAAYGNRIRYVRQPNGGTAQARNRGIREASGDVIAFLDADDQWLPRKLARQVECLASNPDAGLVHADTVRLYEATGERVHVKPDRSAFRGRCYPEFFWANRVTTSTVIIPRRCLDTVGLFDEAIRGPSTEDLDLWLRVARRFPIAYVDEPLAVYRHHGENGSSNLRRMVLDEYYTLRKALREDPAVVGILGSSRIRRKMHGTAFHAGYLCVRGHDLRRARACFAGALRYAPFNAKTWAFWASTFLPMGTRENLRRLRNLVSRAGAAAPMVPPRDARVAESLEPKAWNET